MGAFRNSPRVESTSQASHVLRDSPRLAFDPRRLSAELMIWLRSDLGVALNGSDASRWDDQSGEGNAFAQGTAANQPALVSAGTGGREALYFVDGDEHYLESSFNPYTSFSADDDWTIVVVGGRWDSDNTTSDYYSADGLLGTPKSGSNFLAVGINDSASNKGPIGGFHNGSYRNSKTSTANQVTEGQPYVFVMWNDGGDLESRTNGAANASLSTGVGISSAATGPMRVGDPQTYTNPEYTGDLSEVLVFDGVLDEDEIEELETYIGNRYTIALG